MEKDYLQELPGLYCMDAYILHSNGSVIYLAENREDIEAHKNDTLLRCWEFGSLTRNWGLKEGGNWIIQRIFGLPRVDDVTLHILGGKQLLTIERKIEKRSAILLMNFEDDLQVEIHLGETGKENFPQIYMAHRDGLGMDDYKYHKVYSEYETVWYDWSEGDDR